MADSFAQGLIQSLLQSTQAPQGPSSADMVSIMQSKNPMATYMAANVDRTAGKIGEGVRGMLSGIKGQPVLSPNEALQKGLSTIDMTTSMGLTQAAQLAQKVGKTAEAVQLLTAASELKKQEETQAQAKKMAEIDALYKEAQTAKTLAETPTPEQIEIEAAFRKTQELEAKARTQEALARIAAMPEAQRLQALQLKLQGDRIEQDALQTAAQSKALNAAERKLANDSAQEALSSFNDASNMLRIANAWETNPPTGGILGWSESNVREWFGLQGGEEIARAQYNQVVNSGIINSLPPGVASDADIAMAARGWPDSYANPEMIASFMRGMAKISAFAAEQANVKSKWVREEGTLVGFLDNWMEVSKTPEFKNEVARKYGLEFAEEIDLSGANLPKPGFGSQGNTTRRTRGGN